MPDPIQQFYRAAPLDLTSISDLPHRHFRLFLPNGHFLKVDERIRDSARLRKWLVRFAPQDVYYSVSCWLNPELLGSRYGTPLTSNILLSSDLVFDIDRAPFTVRNLEDARTDTVRLLEFLHSNQYRVRYCAFSGSKGFHVVAKDPKRYPCASPFDREDRARESRQRVLDRIAAEGIELDRKVTLDTRRILRLPGTVNSKTGYVCTVLDNARIRQPVKEILKTIPRLSLPAPRIPIRGDDLPLRGSSIISWLLNRLGVRLGAPEYSYASYITSEVPGIQRLVPFFEFPRRIGFMRAEQTLRHVQGLYNLPDIYLFTSESTISALSLRTFQYRRTAKIVKASGSRDYGSMIRYHRQYFRVGSRIDSKGCVIDSAPEFVRILPGDESAARHEISLPHADLLRSFQVPVRHYPNMHGQGEILMTHTIREH